LERESFLKLKGRKAPKFFKKENLGPKKLGGVKNTLSPTTPLNFSFSSLKKREFWPFPHRKLNWESFKWEISLALKILALPFPGLPNPGQKFGKVPWERPKFGENKLGP